jgi:hypothetical protein
MTDTHDKNNVAIAHMLAAGYTWQQAHDIVTKNPPRDITGENKEAARAEMQRRIGMLPANYSADEKCVARTRIMQDFVDGKLAPEVGK